MTIPQMFRLLLLLPVLSSAAPAPKFELREGDRVAFVGAGFMERESQEGALETMLTRSALGRNVTFRNFAWTGDAVGQDPQKPVRMTRPPKMLKFETYFRAYDPTVVVVSYGQMEAFDGADKLERFLKSYEAWLKELEQGGRRIVVVSPVREEALGGNWPDVTTRNQVLERYVEGIARLAERGGYVFVDLFHALPTSPEQPLTLNAIQLSSYGYEQAAVAMARALQLEPKGHESSEEDPLRAAIRVKNREYWYHYKPQNYEYIYGSRIGNQAGLPDEVNQFARRAAEADQVIARLRRQIASGQRASFEQPQHKEYFQPVDGVLAEDRKALHVKEGFAVDVFAADPSIQKPVALAWDARGRLWASTTTVYPQIRPGQQPVDRIIILEDTDRDGQADKHTVFIDDLYMPTGLLPVKGGCYVFDEVFFAFLPDANGDDRADRKEILLAGFGAEDNHHKGHTFRWSPDGRIHFQQGIFLHTTVETTYGLRQHLKAGIFQYEPESGRFETYLANSIPPNPWGHYWNEWGQDFHIDSSGQNGSTFIIPTAGASSAHLMVPGGNAKLAAAEILSGRHFGPEFDGDLIAPPFKENRVAHWKFSDDSSGYALKALEPLIVSSNRNFRPVDPRMGPDGALYIADWYNPLIGHMQHHLNDPARDHFRGRIWRVTRAGVPALPVVDFTKLSVEQCLEHLKDPEQFNRNMARRVLVEYHPAEKVLAAIPSWLRAADAAEKNYGRLLVETLWLYQNLRRVPPDFLKEVLRAREANARAAATAAFRDPYVRAAVTNGHALLTQQVQDEHPRVRLQAVTSLSYFPTGIESAAMAVDRPLDRYIEQALKQTAEALKGTWVPAFGRGELTFGGQDARRNYILQIAGMSGNVGPLVNLLLDGKANPAQLDANLEVIAQGATEEQLFKLQRAPLEPPVMAKVWRTITKAVRDHRRGFKPDNNELREKLLGGATEEVVVEAARLAGATRNDYVRTNVHELAEAGRSALVRAGAIEALAFYGGEQEVALLKKLAGDFNPQPTRAQAAMALVAVDQKFAAERAAALLQSGDLRDVDVPILFRSFLNRKNGARDLAAAMVGNAPHQDAAKLGLRAMHATGRQDEKLVEILTAASGLGKSASPLNKAEMETLMAEITTRGDPVRGEQVFRRTELSCLQCHAISSAGGMVGPDLSAVGSGSTLDYLIDALLLPSKTIKEGFETLEVTTKDDEYFLGIRVRENSRELVLRDAVREMVIPKKEISERRDKASSIMPDGLTASLTHAEVVDLLRFMSELGKPGPFANNPAPLIRRWRTGQEPASFPVYSYVSGDLPLADLRDGRARAEIDITTPGQVKLKINSITGLKFAVDGKPLLLATETILDLERGQHVLEFTVEPGRSAPLRVELDEVPGSKGRAQVVAGR